jgi:hypothetical protein
MSTHWFALPKELMYVIAGFLYVITTYNQESGRSNGKRCLYFTKIREIALFLLHLALIAVELLIAQNSVSMQR